MRAEPSLDWVGSSRGLDLDWWTRLRSVFVLDARAIALFRVGLAVVVIGDVASRAFSLAQLTDEGPVTRAFLRAHAASATPSLLMLDGGTPFATAFLIVTALAAVWLALGFRARTAAAVVLVLVASIQDRNPLVFMSGDVLLRALLFLSLFVPLGARFSIDARRAQTTSPSVVEGAPAALFFVQVVALYLVGAVIKFEHETWRDLSALSHVLASDLLAAPAGTLLRGHDGILTLFTGATLLIEVVAPLLLLVPSARARTAGIVSLAALQLGIWLTMAHGQFQAIALVAMLPLLPGALLDETRLRGSREERFDVDPRADSFAERVRAIGARAVLVVLILVNTVAVFRGGAVLGIEPLRLVALDQSWGMYRSPGAVPSGWFVVVGTRADGQVVELLTGKSPPSTARPESVFSTYADFRTRRMWEWLLFEPYAPFAPEVARFVCHDGERIAGAPLVHVRALFVGDHAQREGAPTSALEVFDRDCVDR